MRGKRGEGMTARRVRSLRRRWAIDARGEAKRPGASVITYRDGRDRRSAFRARGGEVAAQVIDAGCASRARRLPFVKSQPERDEKRASRGTKRAGDMNIQRLKLRHAPIVGSLSKNL